MLNTWIACGLWFGIKWRRNFRRKFTGITVARIVGSHKLINEVTSAGLPSDKKPAKRRRALTEQRVYEIRVRLEHTPQKSRRDLPQETVNCKLAAGKAMKLSKLSTFAWSYFMRLRFTGHSEGQGVQNELPCGRESKGRHTKRNFGCSSGGTSSVEFKTYLNNVECVWVYTAAFLTSFIIHIIWCYRLCGGILTRIGKNL
jgi:hypothetical protein